MEDALDRTERCLSEDAEYRLERNVSKEVIKFLTVIWEVSELTE